MELTVLGSGTAVPHPRRSSAGYWLQTGAGSVMLDFSAPAHHRVAQEQLDWPDLDAIWISHFHLDHCAGLSAFLFGTRRAPETVKRTKPLRIFGAKGLKDLLNIYHTAAKGKLLDQPFPLEVIEVDHLEKFELLPGVEAVPFSTPHTEDSHAIHIRDGETTLVYTGDTGMSEPLAAFARKVDLLLMECSFVKDKAVDKHLELVEAVQLIRRAEPRRAMLTHFYSEWDGVNFEEEVRKLRPGIEIIQAEDGLKVVV